MDKVNPLKRPYSIFGRSVVVSYRGHKNGCGNAKIYFYERNFNSL